ncbi:MAG TPA: glycosyltransferase family A protein, partial [bacterium]|nr:glycosyltransferase family A protein [bacterium]
VSSTTSTSAWQLLRFYGDHVRVRELADELYRKEREIEAAEERTREVERAWRAGYARQDRRARDAAAGRTWDAVTAQVTPRFLVERVRTAGAGWRPRGSSADRWRQAVEWATGRPAGAPPRAGLVITSHEDGEFLPDLLNSLSRQTVTDFEVVLVDDYSVDPITVELLDALQGADGLEVFRLPRPCGVIEARNAGVSRLRAPVVACLDADDLVAPEYLEATLSELDRVPSAGFVYFDYRMFGTVEGRVRSPDFDVDRLLDDNYIVASAPFRRRLWEEVGGFWSGMWRGFEDWEFWVHCVARGWSGCRIPRELFYYRRRAASRNSAALAHKEECAALIRSRHPELFGSRGRAGEMGGGHSTDRDPSTP